ncbi:potential channel 4-associated protein [Seminavis robusta]|uniref:Potential channel 4-associated protein n=1 Tax=Seminavis robusta TaxID=568900 RepID=A0A9N8HER6_9STRA|nr:potential channel 4-associated protein [Seminavis robusta]|eukprot:Sro397_g134520.1 potential channel 4-associated protein (1557) ;mRNA; f:51578-56248
MEEDLHPSLASFTEADMEGVDDDDYEDDENGGSATQLNDSFGMDNPPPAIDAVDADAQDAARNGGHNHNHHDDDDDEDDDDEGYDDYEDDASADGMLPPLLLAENADCDCDDEEEMVDMYEDDTENLGYSNKRGFGGGNSSGGLGYGSMGGGSGLRRSSTCTDNSGSSISDYDDEEMYEFFPPVSRHHEWMGRSIEALVFGHLAKTSLLSLIEDDDASDDASSAYAAFRRRSTASTFGGDFSHRRSSAGGSFAGTRRGSLSLTTGGQGGPMHGGTMANYYNRRRPMQPMDVDRSVDRRRSSNAHAPSYRRRSSMACSGGPGATGQHGNEPEAEQRAQAGPNVVFNLLAREMTGRSTTPFPNLVPAAQALRAMGGDTLYGALDKPAAGISTEVGFLVASIEAGDWAETQMIISRLAPRLIGDPSAAMPQGPEGRQAVIDDPNLPPSASPFYAGGGRVGLERDAFVQAGGVEAMIRIFREKTFVGQEMAKSFDARDLSKGLVATRLAPCWNEALASLRELIFAIPALVENGTVLENGDFLPFLFTLLAHDSCFDGAAALIEEILSLMSHSPQAQAAAEDNDGASGDEGPTIPPLGRVAPVTTFFLGNVPELYELWGGFNCRQLAHFCRILALLVFEPEDRQLLESPAVLKSLELLQLRRNRAVRAGRDSTVDMNQAILLGDPDLSSRMLKLLRVMNYAPSVRRSSPYHVMAHFPFIADTLVMLGLSEIDSWEEIDRLESLSRKLLNTGTSENGGQDSKPKRIVSELGTVADMLENLSNTLLRSNAPVTNQLGHIIHVISAAQQAGVVVGRPGNDNLNVARHRPSASGLEDPEWMPQGGNSNGNAPDNGGEDNSNPPLDMGSVAVDGTTIRGLASAAGVLTDQVLVRRLYAGESEDSDDVGGSEGPRVFGIGSLDGPQGRDSGSFFSEAQICAPKDAANALQFNALLLGPYQVEVLFVLCTLLGGRRKMDAQKKLDVCNVIPILDDMFQRLPWYSSQREEAAADSSNNNGNANGNSRQGGSGNGNDPPDGEEEQQPNGIHGPGCECTPESALCVQYLRLLHNFCDRDCDNYPGRHSLLSPSERELIFRKKGGNDYNSFPVEQGLLSKIVEAFARESDESPYRFWLASCIESYLRGSSPGEQVFVARSGLLMHLVEDITSERLHCAGSLQTSFDLLGELCKGNNEVLNLLVSDLDEESFRKFMSVAAANLVDSNVFIRSLWLTLERLSAANRQVALHFDSGMGRGSSWRSPIGPSSRYYLTHSWWDTMGVALESEGNFDIDNDEDETNDLDRPSDWFPTSEVVEAQGMHTWNDLEFISSMSGLNESVGHFGWVFSPVGENLSAATFEPNTTERLSWFLAANQARLLRDLLGVVDLRNINHENICCLNTAVVIAIFAHRRHQLAALLTELSQMNAEEKESKRRAIDPTSNGDDLIDRAFVNAMRYLDLDEDTPSYARRASLTLSRRDSITNSHQIGDRTDVMRNFREVLWFWFEYYTHRGRDRLSLEFSSHLRFQEWMQVVYRLVADDSSPTSLVRTPVRLPRSPYQSAARITDNNPLRGV